MVLLLDVKILSTLGHRGQIEKFKRVETGLQTKQPVAGLPGLIVVASAPVRLGLLAPSADDLLNVLPLFVCDGHVVVSVGCLAALGML
jgi:hypothetical protein